MKGVFTKERFPDVCVMGGGEGWPDNCICVLGDMKKYVPLDLFIRRRGKYPDICVYAGTVCISTEDGTQPPLQCR